LMQHMAVHNSQSVFVNQNSELSNRPKTQAKLKQQKIENLGVLGNLDLVGSSNLSFMEPVNSDLKNLNKSEHHNTV